MSNALDAIGRSGLGIAVVTCDDPDYVLSHSSAIEMIDLRRDRLVPEPVRAVLARQAHRRRFARHKMPAAQVALLHPNAYVNTGLNNALDREFGLGGTAISHIGVDNNSSAVTAATTYLHGAAGATAANQIIKAISPAASRSSQTVTAGATFANADFTSSVFIINKLGLLIGSTDNGSNLVDVIGGTGGASPYNRTFSLDLTGAGTFSATLQVAVTAAAA